MADEEKPAAQRTLEAQLNSVRFQAGVEEGRWSILRYEFPILEIRVSAANFAGTHVECMDFQLICDDFPALGPFVQLWDFAAKARKKGPSEGSPDQ